MSKIDKKYLPIIGMAVVLVLIIGGVFISRQTSLAQQLQSKQWIFGQDDEFVGSMDFTEKTYHLSAGIINYTDSYKVTDNGKTLSLEEGTDEPLVYHVTKTNYGYKFTAANDNTESSSTLSEFQLKERK